MWGVVVDAAEIAGHPGKAAAGREGYGVAKDDPPPCGHCAGSGRVTYQRPRQREDGSVTWVDSVENCHVCDGTGLCR
ncbi:hypothetical protein GCM10009550_26630 [Actinocorallia libanotica]|jgi:DnaJ-class molecular chaperone|uniref:Uncharacterized protein n=1 Tax=Actinocorallia libanotica TaxID=46162 RepID=A0ABN1QYM5_9ACTN